MDRKRHTGDRATAAEDSIFFLGKIGGVREKGF
jgi:hypothetical protein